MAGVLLILLALLHLSFPKRFNWREEFRSVSLLSRQMFYVHTGFIGLVVFLNGLLFLFLAPELLTRTSLSSGILGGVTVFWATRFVIQFWGYSADLWRGKRFETTIHVVATLVWTYLTLSSGLALIASLS